MFDYVEVDRLDAAAALAVLEQAQRAKRQAEVQEALAMLRVVKSYRHQIAAHKVQLAAEGTGLIDDFGCLELAAALGRSAESVTAQVIELLNLETRLPRLWEQVVACGVPLWLGRKLARTTAELSLVRALWVDATLAPFATRLAPGRLIRFAEALVVQADPAAAEIRWARQHGRRVDISQTEPDGLRSVYGWLTAADATYLDASLNQLATILLDQGSTETADARRATALGILATPARALALIQHAVGQPALVHPGEPDELGVTSARLEDNSGGRSPQGCAGHSCGTITVPPDALLPKATLIVHLSDDSLTTGVGVGRCEQLGPLAVQQIRQLLAGSRVTVRPVFNPNGIIPVDCYEIPASMRRAVLQRHPYEVFPFGTRPSARLDLDHTRPYRAGLSRQTDPDNLGPLRRKTHRAKTHAGWRLSQTQPGFFTWTSPLGRRYVVTPAGITNPVVHPPGTNPWDHPLGGPLLPELTDPPRAPRSSGRRRLPANAQRTAAMPVLRR